MKSKSRLGNRLGWKILFALLVLVLSTHLIQAASITTNVTETNINSSVAINGTGFIANTNYSIELLLENKSSWWDGFNEQWLPAGANATILVATDANGNLSYTWNIPNDWRISGGKTLFKIGQQVGGSLMWSAQGTNWTVVVPTKNGVTGDSDPNGFIYTGSNAPAANQGGMEKFYKSNGSLACAYNLSAVENINDLTNNGSLVYLITSAATNNLRAINMSNCGLNVNVTTAGVVSWSINVAPNNKFVIITYAANTAPRMYNISNSTPTNVPAFAATAVNSIAYDSCIAPNSSVVYVGYANGNVTALNAATGAVIWNSDPTETELGDPGFAFQINGISCDDQRVYVARNQISYPAGIINQGFVEALWAVNGSRAWVNSKTDTIYDGMDVNNIRCDSNNCYAVKALTPAPYQGVVGSAIFQINKTTGNVTWWTWRSWLYPGFNYNNITYGNGTLHSAAQTLWVDNDTNGFIYPVYTNGWVQKIAKNDVNASTYDPGFWIRGLTNFWNYVADVPKNIWLSNETPYFNFRHWNQQGMPLNTTSPNLVGTFFRYSMLNTFNSFTAYEYSVANVLGNSIFIDPVMQVTPTQRNAVQFFWNTAPGVATCTAARYGYVNLNGWYYEDRNCHYTEVPATLTGYNIGTTINGTFITGIVYSLIKTKFWEYYPITKYYGNDNWAWASWYNQSTNQQLGFATKFGSDQEDVYSDNYGRAVLFTNSAAIYYYRPLFRADLNRKTDTYILFKPQGALVNGTSYIWGDVDTETKKIANPVILNYSNDESGSYTVGIYSYAHRINFTAQEPNLLNRTNEPVEIIFNATGGMRADCKDAVITDDTDTPVFLWQIDNSTACLQNNNISIWIMLNWTQNESKSLRLYYNGSSSTPTPVGITDLNVTFGGICGTSQEINVTSSNYYNWTRPAAATVANEQTRYMLGTDNTTNMWAAAVHYQVASCYKNTNTTGTGIGIAVDTCGVAAAPVSKCLLSGSNGKIFAKLNATVAMAAIPNRYVGANTMYVEYYFFANTGRVRIRTILNQSLPILNTTVSKNWPPYYNFSINGLIPPSGTNSWLYYSGLYEQMKKPIAIYNPSQTEVNLSVGPFPLLFTIRYGGFGNVSQANGSVLQPASLDQNFWDKGCTAHKIWEYYSYTGAATYGTAAAPIYTSEFISCDDSLASQLPKLGQPGYVNVIPEMSWDGTTVNKWYDPTLIGKFYMMPNIYRPYNRENRLLGPYATSADPVVGDVTPYSLSARISSYIVPLCPEEQYGYKGYDDFLKDVPNLIANTAIQIRNNTQNIPCAAQIIKFTDQRGSDGIHIIFARNLTVIVGETMSAGWAYPSNTFASGTYSYQPDGVLDMTFAQKSSQTAGYYGKFYFTYTPNNYVIDAFSTSGAPQFMLPGTPSNSGAVTASMYTTRYAFAPEAFYTKNVFDESALWNKTVQNFTYYRNPCWLGRYDNIYGSTATGHPALAALSTPGWQNQLWGSSINAYSTTCAHNNYNLEVQDVFRPGWGSKVPTAADTLTWNELFIDGRENFAGNGTPPNAQDTYYVARHNALSDDKHSDDFNSVLNDYSDLNQNEKHPNKQPWYCQISRHTNRSFCVMTNSLSTLIYNFAPGAGLTATQGWSPYWSSVREATTFRNYYISRYGDVAAWQWPFDNILDVTMYPTLQRSEVLTANLLYTTDNPDDYQTFFRNQFPTAEKSLAQTQFLLKDWKNAAFMYFDQDSRQYAPGLPMSIIGIALYNGSVLNNTNITLGIYNSQDALIQEVNTTTNSSGMFNWTTTLPSSMSAGLNYVRFNYNNTLFDRVPFRTINLVAVISSDKAAYEQLNNATTTISITNSYTGSATDPDQLELRYINPSNQVMECAKYPSSASVAGCPNNLTKTGTGLYSYNIYLGTDALGVYTERATVTQTGIAADFTSSFVIAIIDPCKASPLYNYALGYPMSYNSTTDTITVIGNSTFGTASNPIRGADIYAFSQATKGTCIFDEPSPGTFVIYSRVIIGNGTQEVYVLSSGESVSFLSEAMPQLLVNKNAHMSFGVVTDGIPQEGSNIKFRTNLTSDITLDVAGGELAFYDSYVGDTGNYWGRFMYRGSCGILPEESSDVNSSIIIKKTTFDRASKGQFFFTGNVTIDDMKINRINSTGLVGYGLVSGCALPMLHNLQIYHQADNGSGIFVANNTPANTSLTIKDSFFGNNTIDIIAGNDGRGVQLINTIWDRRYAFNWTNTWTGTTDITEISVHNLTFMDSTGLALTNASMTMMDTFGNIASQLMSQSSGVVMQHYIPAWQVEKTTSGEIVTDFNPYRVINKKYGKIITTESKSFLGTTNELKQLEDNPFVHLSESAAAQVSNVTYNEPIKVNYGDESHNTWSLGTEQLSNYPIDSCQYTAIFANKTRLIEGLNYTLSYDTGQITFLTSVAGYNVYPVYYYGGNITLTNGLALADALTMDQLYARMEYLTSHNNLSEDLITIDGVNYNFCVNLALGNQSAGGGISDHSKTINFNNGYALSVSSNGGLFDLAGIGGSGTLGAIEVSKQIVYPGDIQTIFVSMSDSSGNPLTGKKIYAEVLYPNGSSCINDNTPFTEIGTSGLYKYQFSIPTGNSTSSSPYGAYAVHITTTGISEVRTFEYSPIEDVSIKGSAGALRNYFSWLDAKVWVNGRYIEVDGRVVNNRDYNITLSSSDLYQKDLFVAMPPEFTTERDTWYVAEPTVHTMIDNFTNGDISAWAISGNYSNITGTCGIYGNACAMNITLNFSNGGDVKVSRNFSSVNETYDSNIEEAVINLPLDLPDGAESMISRVIVKHKTDENNYFIENGTLADYRSNYAGWNAFEPYYRSAVSSIVGNPNSDNITGIEVEFVGDASYTGEFEVDLGPLAFSRNTIYPSSSMGTKSKGTYYNLFWWDPGEVYTLQPNEERPFYIGTDSPIYYEAQQWNTLYPTDIYVQQKIQDIFNAKFYLDQLKAEENIKAYITGLGGANVMESVEVANKDIRPGHIQTVYVSLTNTLGNPATGQNVKADLFYPNGTLLETNLSFDEYIPGFYRLNFRMPPINTSIVYGAYSLRVSGGFTAVRTFNLIPVTDIEITGPHTSSGRYFSWFDAKVWDTGTWIEAEGSIRNNLDQEVVLSESDLYNGNYFISMPREFSTEYNSWYVSERYPGETQEIDHFEDPSFSNWTMSGNIQNVSRDCTLDSTSTDSGCGMHLVMNFTNGGDVTLGENITPNINMTYDFWATELNLAININLPDDISTIDRIVVKYGTDANDYYIENKTLRYWKISRGGWQVLEPYYNSEFAQLIGNPDPQNITFFNVTIVPIKGYNGTLETDLADIEFRKYTTLSTSAMGTKANGEANYLFWMDNLTTRTYTLAENEERDFYVGLESPMYKFAYQLAAQFPTDQYIQARVYEIYDAQFYWEQLSAWDRLNAYLTGTPGKNLFLITSLGTAYDSPGSASIEMITTDRLGNLLNSSITVSVDYPNGTVMNSGVPNMLSDGRYSYAFNISSASPDGSYIVYINATGIEGAGQSTYDVKTFRIPVSSNQTGGNGSGGIASLYPIIELAASTPIATSTVSSIGALIKSSAGTPVNCDGALGLTIRDIATGLSTFGLMTSFSAGMYNYSWTTSPTPGVFYVNASCTISGIDYTGFTLISTQQIGAIANVDYVTLANYVWNYTSRNLTYYDQSVSTSIQSCLKDAQCSGWWMNTTLSKIDSVITQINSTSNSIKNTTDNLFNQFNCTTPNDMCTRLQNILNNVTDIQARVNSMNTSQIPALQTSINNVYTDTQFIRTNMATLSALQSMNATLYSMLSSINQSMQNMLTQSAFDSNVSDLRSRLNEINSTTRSISSSVNCSSPVNSALCIYLNNTNNSVNLIYSNMATYSQASNLTSNISSIIQSLQNMLTQSAFNASINASMSDLRSRLSEINSTVNAINSTANIINSTSNIISLGVNCSSPSNSALCSYLDNIYTNTGSIYSDMATAAQISSVYDDTQWLRTNVATQDALTNNFSSVISKLNAMNFTLGNIINITNNIANNTNNLDNTLNALNQNLSQQLTNLQTNISWIISNVATSSEISSNFTETFNKILGLNLSLINIQNYLYTNMTNNLAEINYTTHNATTYLYTALYDTITSRLSELNTTNHDMYSYMILNISPQLGALNTSDLSNITGIVNGLNSLQSDVLFMKNNMFYQGNATGSFLVDYVASVVTSPGNREDLWIATRDLLGNEKTVSYAECYVMKQNSVIYNATVIINNGGVHAYWDVASNQTNGDYYWNCTLTGSIMHMQVPFFVSNYQTPDFTIDSLTAGSPRYPNEQALIEATFSNENGTAVDPDAINLTLYTPNGNVWATANKQNFTKNSYNIWSYAKDIESNPTTGMYSVQMMASYNGMTSSKTVQFRIATGGPYKVYLDCPTTSYIGQDLVCNVILKDEGEAATESISTVWVDLNNNGVLDVGEPQASFSKRTVPLQNVTQPVAVNIPISQLSGLYNVRAETSYVNSAQPDSTASDSVLFSIAPVVVGGGGSGGGSSGGGSGGSSNSGGVLIRDYGNNNQQMCVPSASTAQTCAPSAQFRDVLVRVLDDYKIVTPDSKILVELTMYNVGANDMKDAVVQYCIKTESLEVVNCVEENDVISSKLQLIKEILIPKDMPDGKYYLSAVVTYDNKNVSSDTTFTVRSGSNAANAANKEIPGTIKSNTLANVINAFSGLDFNKVYIIILTLIVLLLIVLSHNRSKPPKEKSYRPIIIERRDSSRDSSKEPSKESSKESSGESSKESSKESSRDSSHEHSKEKSERSESEKREKSENDKSEKSESEKQEKNEKYEKSEKENEHVKEKHEDDSKDVFEDKSASKNKSESEKTAENEKNNARNDSDRTDSNKNDSDTNSEKESEESIILKQSAKEKLASLKVVLHTLCSEEKVFVLPNHKTLHSIMELLESLPGMSEDIFNHHTKQGRNDFANWIRGVFEEKELAKIVEKCDSNETLISALRDYFKL